MIATCGGDNKICILEVGLDNALIVKDVINNAHGDSDINSVAWCPMKSNEDFLLSGGDDNSVKVWKL
jgi:WD40 repeat protein